jgi:hypothetical protein
VGRCRHKIYGSSHSPHQGRRGGGKIASHCSKSQNRLMKRIIAARSHDEMEQVITVFKAELLSLRLATLSVRFMTL